MCGRYTLKDPKALAGLISHLTGEPYELVLARYLFAAGRYNVAPSQENPVVTTNSAGLPAATTMKWGPLYPMQGGKPALMVNARSETAATKPSFKPSLQARRCVVPADGFFEWKREAKTKTPYLFELQERKPFWIAGLFEEATPEAPRSYLLLTTGPNELMAPIHDRMPVILDDNRAKQWLAPGPLTPNAVADVCVPFPAAQMTSRPVNSVVNNARNDVPACIEPASEKPIADESDFRLE